MHKHRENHVRKADDLEYSQIGRKEKCWERCAGHGDPSFDNLRQNQRQNRLQILLSILETSISFFLNMIKREICETYHMFRSLEFMMVSMPVMPQRLHIMHETMLKIPSEFE